ncbi:MAG: hypothetical protein AAF402_09410 [Pseudomonadota bacterium]
MGSDLFGLVLIPRGHAEVERSDVVQNLKLWLSHELAQRGEIEKTVSAWQSFLREESLRVFELLRSDYVARIRLASHQEWQDQTPF